MAEVDKKRRLEDADGVGVASATDEERKQQVTAWLRPLTEIELRKMLVDLGGKSAVAYDLIHDLASENLSNRKVFVRGLPWDAGADLLRSAFEQFGEVEDCVVVTEKPTGKSKGFGFVTFRDMDAAYRATAVSSKEIGGRITECNLASLRQQPAAPKPMQGGMGPMGGMGGPAMGGPGPMGGHMGMAPGAGAGGGETEESRKLFVRSLSWDTDSERLKAYFSAYGEVENAQVVTHKETGKSRGYGFITFRNAVMAQAALVEPEKMIDGRLTVSVLAAVGDAKRQLQMQQQGLGGAPGGYPAGAGAAGAGANGGWAGGYGQQGAAAANGQWPQQAGYGAQQNWQQQQAYGQAGQAGQAAAYGQQPQQQVPGYGAAGQQQWPQGAYGAAGYGAAAGTPGAQAGAWQG